MNESDLTEADWGAIAAAQDADPVPEIVLTGTVLGECRDCGARFPYQHPHETSNLDPCPECRSWDWFKWGYRTQNGDEVPVEEVNDVE